MIIKENKDKRVYQLSAEFYDNEVFLIFFVVHEYVPRLFDGFEFTFCRHFVELGNVVWEDKQGSQSDEDH